MGAAILAVLVLADGLATRLERVDPILASRIAPYDARVAAAAAKTAVTAGADVRDPRVRKYVRRALSRDATIASAIEYRALAFGAAGDGARQARLFGLSDAISRRSLGTRLWLIQRSVDRGDVAGALRNFDIALRTSMAAQDILFPILAGATTDPALVGPIARMVDRPSDWRVMFLNHAISKPGSARTIAPVVLQMRNREDLIGNGFDQRLVAKLVEEGDFETARRVQDWFHPPRSGSGVIRDPDFGDPKAQFPFGWGLTQSGDAGAGRDLLGGRTALSYQAPDGSAGQVAAQLLMLAPGRYRLDVTTASPPADPTSPPYWTLTCAEKAGAQIALLDLGGGPFAVPPGCKAQWLALNLRASDAPRGQSGAIRSVSIAPQS